MIDLEQIRQTLAVTDPWVEKHGTHWLNPGPGGVRELAQVMNSVGARFVTITAYELSAIEGFRLEYHWDLESRLLGFPFIIVGNSILSLCDSCEAADWIEREVHEGFAIDFAGREHEPLLLRPGDKIGVNLKEFAPATSAPGASGEKEVAQ
jgi:hypothetical protein